MVSHIFHVKQETFNNQIDTTEKQSSVLKTCFDPRMEQNIYATDFMSNPVFVVGGVFIVCVCREGGGVSAPGNVRAGTKRGNRSKCHGVGEVSYDM